MTNKFQKPNTKTEILNMIIFTDVGNKKNLLSIHLVLFFMNLSPGNFIFTRNGINKCLAMNKLKLTRILLTALFLISFGVLNISNYGTGSLILKILVNIFLWLTLFAKLQSENISLFNILCKINKKFYYVLALFIIIPALTLIYSVNIEFGISKLFHLVFFGLSFIIAFRIMLLTCNQEDINIFLVISRIIILVTAGIIFIFNPFIQNQIYEFSIGRWSHVVYARFTAPLLIILFIQLFNYKNFKKILLESFVIGAGFYAIYISNMRAAFLGLLLMFPLLTIVKIVKSKIKWYHLAGIIFSAILFIILITLSPGNDIIKERYSNMLIGSKNDIEKDLSMQSRIIGYMVSWEMIKSNPVLGVGFGGFRNYNKENLELHGKYDEINISEFTEWLKYSHNIFIEFQVEMGLAGSVLFVFLLYVIFNSVRKYSAEVVIIYLFAFWFAMLSKDIPSNIFLFTGLAFYGSPYETERIKELLFPKRNSGVR